MARSSTSVEPGNDLAVTHGAQSAIVAINSPLVAQQLAELEESIDFLQPADRVLVEQAARLLVRIRLIDEYLDRLGGSLIDARGRPRGCWKLYTSLQHQLRQTLAQLGVGPAIRAEMATGIAALRSAKAAESARDRLRAAVAAGEA